MLNNLNSLLPKLRIKEELIFAAYPNLNSYSLSRLKTLEHLSIKLKKIAELERSINIFILNNWQQIDREKRTNGGAWGDVFQLQLKAEAKANFNTALAEIKKSLQATNAGAWFSSNKPGEITLSGSRREVLNQLGICGVWLDQTTWPLTVGTLCALKAIDNTKLEDLLGGTRAAFDLILNS